MDKKYTNIKERVIIFAKSSGLSIETFLLSIGMTYGSFKGKAKEGSLNSDAIAKIFTNHPLINLEWLLTGKGKMTIEEKIETLNIEKVPIKEDLKHNEVELLKKDLETVKTILESKSETINTQKDFISNLKADIQRLNTEIEQLKSKE